MVIIIILISLLATAVIIIFNRLIRYKNLMREASSGIDVQLKKRHDLVPNIVKAVSGYMQHERSLLENITRIRTELITPRVNLKKGEAENKLSQALKSIFALAEAYPDLKANQNFLHLQKELINIEDQLQMARRYYNGTVRNYNILVQSFPANIIARLFVMM